MIQFYVPDIQSVCELPSSEASHCVRVLRRDVGDEIICVDGRGSRYRCVIEEATAHKCSFRIVETENITNHWQNNITLCFAPTKNLDRIEWMVEKCTEIGIDNFVAMRCAHSERKEMKAERIQKIIISAMKQSLKTVLPTLQPLTPIKDVLMAPFAGQKFICYCADDLPRHELVADYRPDTDVKIMIGPEGDFSPEEVQLAMDYDWVPVSLGQSRLRTETAGVYAVAAIHTINELKSVK